MKQLENTKQTKQVVMFAGDIHGNIGHAEWVISHAKKNEVTHIISVGDFGYWVHRPFGKQFVNRVAKLAEEAQIKFLWIDGNHENHDLLRDLTDKYGKNNPIPTPNEWLQYIPRGCRFQIGETTFMGYGGAYSVDWLDRVEGDSWWRGELINPFDVDLLSNEPVDILMTHEAPYNNGEKITYKDDIQVSIAQRHLVKEILDKVTPQFHICGHHHTRVDWMDGETEVSVLGRDGMDSDSVLILELGVDENELAESVSSHSFKYYGEEFNRLLEGNYSY
jgi:Icc-related predicted phosphoesterase